MPLRPTYWLTRFVLLRLLGVVYFVAFLSLARQVLPLIGHDGLLPAAQYLDRLAAHLGSRRAGFFALPSVFWVDGSDRLPLARAWPGTALSLFVVARYANALLPARLWALYISFVHVRHERYGYRW